MKFKTGEAMNANGELVPAFGFEHNGMFIVNPYLSDCGRFTVDPSEYGLTADEARELAALNKGKV